jgi:predicted nucleic acid-binding protein
LCAERILLDDGAASATAKNRGLRVVGVLGILLTAKRRGLLSSVREDMDALTAAQFRVSPRLQNSFLAAAGEL